MKNKPTLKKQIEQSQKGIDYVNSLVPKDNETGLSWEIAERAMRNNISEEFEKHKKDRLKQIDFEIKLSKRILIGFMLFLISVFIYKTFINP